MNVRITNPRPATPTLIVVESDGEIISLANDHLSASPAKREIIKRAVAFEEEVCVVEPNLIYFPAQMGVGASLLGRLAALFSAAPGRSRLLEAPDELWDLLNDLAGDFDEDNIY